MLEMLVKYGYVEDAWTLLTREEYPSIGFMIQNEATTVWERFELKKESADELPQSPHVRRGQPLVLRLPCRSYAAGRRLEALRRPAVLPGEAAFPSAGVPTPYGEAVLRWVHRYGSRYVYLQVPFGTTAVVTLPGLGTFEAGSGFHHWELPE